MEYRTVFDIATAGYKSWHFPAFGLIFIVVGVLLIANRKNLPGWWGKNPKAANAFAFYFLGFALLWTGGAFVSTYGQYASLARAIDNKSARVVEGIVTNFRPMPYAGHAMEKFCVASTCFEYSDYIIAAGFNNAASHGGPIHDGLPVRVTYVGNSILKLEVAK